MNIQKLTRYIVIGKLRCPKPIGTMLEKQPRFVLMKFMQREIIYGIVLGKHVLYSKQHHVTSYDVKSLQLLSSVLGAYQLIFPENSGRVCSDLKKLAYTPFN